MTTSRLGHTKCKLYVLAVFFRFFMSSRTHIGALPTPYPLPGYGILFDALHSHLRFFGTERVFSSCQTLGNSHRQLPLHASQASDTRDTSKRHI